LRSKLLLTKSRNSPPCMEPKGSVSCSQEPATGPYPNPDESSPNITTLFPQDIFLYYPTIFSFSQEISHLLWNPEATYYVYKSPPQVKWPLKLFKLKENQNHSSKSSVDLPSEYDRNLLDSSGPVHAKRPTDVHMLLKNCFSNERKMCCIYIRCLRYSKRNKISKYVDIKIAYNVYSLKF
jgi:hypothetical protein